LRPAQGGAKIELMPSRSFCLILAAIAGMGGVLGAGCGGPASPTTLDGPILDQPCAAGQRVGSFSIELTDQYTSVGGKVFDAVAPRDVPVELAADGACTLFAAPLLQCNPECDATRQVCAEGNQCRPQPVARDLGKVTIRGLLVPLELQPNLVTKAYTIPAYARLPNPGFEPGAQLRLSSSGGDYKPIDLRGWGVSLLEGVTNPIRVRVGQAVTVSWQAPSDAGPARVHLNLNINHHGSTSNWLECDVEDVGSAEIPVSLVDALLARGLSGFPTLTVTRRSVSSRSIEPGCVELLVSSESVSDVELDDFQSCGNRDDCAPGQACGPEFFCQ
jgi:hypothetical protein